MVVYYFHMWAIANKGMFLKGYILNVEEQWWDIFCMFIYIEKQMLGLITLYLKPPNKTRPLNGSTLNKGRWRKKSYEIRLQLYNLGLFLSCFCFVLFVSLSDWLIVWNRLSFCTPSWPGIASWVLEFKVWANTPNTAWVLNAVKKNPLKTQAYLHLDFVSNKHCLHTSGHSQPWANMCASTGIPVECLTNKSNPPEEMHHQFRPHWTHLTVSGYKTRQ